MTAEHPEHDATVVEVPRRPHYQAQCHTCIWKGRVYQFKVRADAELREHIGKGH